MHSGRRRAKVMTVERLAALLLASAALAAAAEAPFYLHDGDHVVFYGDSITDQRLYTVITETYVVTRYPKLKIDFTHSGWGGDKVSGGGGGPIDERLKRDVVAYKPTVMTIMLGMNDGLYRAETEANDRVFMNGYRHMVESVRAQLPALRITAIEPSPYDDVTRRPIFPGGYNEVLLSFSRWIGNYAEENHMTVADLNTGVVEMLQRANELDPVDAQKIIPDRVHPKFAGHLSMAEQLIRAWHGRETVSQFEIRGDGAPSVVSQDHTAISDLSGGNHLQWTALDDALPLPFALWEQMWDAGPLALVYRASDVADALNRQVMRVTGLKPGVYALAIDGETVATRNDGDWARGVNLGLLETPMSRQAKEVFDMTVRHCDIHNDRWRTLQVPLERIDLPGKRAAMEELDRLELEVVRHRQEIGQPKPHHFELHLVS